MGKAETKAKNQAMAARMKAEGVERRTGVCPICHREMGLGALIQHIGQACRKGDGRGV